MRGLELLKSKPILIQLVLSQASTFLGLTDSALGSASPLSLSLSLIQCGDTNTSARKFVLKRVATLHYPTKYLLFLSREPTEPQRSNHYSCYPMDPVSIVSLAASLTLGAYQVSSFIASSASVDTTLTELGTEVIGLGKVLQSIEQSLKGPAAARKGGGAVGEAELWTSLAFAIKDADRTITALQGIVQSLLGTKSTNFLRRLVRQAKLNLNTDQINAIRARIHTHTSSLQAALQMATL